MIYSRGEREVKGQRKFFINYPWLALEYKFLLHQSLTLKNTDTQTLGHLLMLQSKVSVHGISLAVQWLRVHTSNSWGAESIPSQETKIPHAAWCNQKKKRLSPAYGELWPEWTWSMARAVIIHLLEAMENMLKLSKKHNYIRKRGKLSQRT